MAFDFEKALRRRTSQHAELVELKNSKLRDESGVFERWENPVLTPSHAPLFWRYDLDPRRNPFLLERLGVSRVSGGAAIEWNGRICLVTRVQGADGRSFFAVAESESGVDNFRFWDYPVALPAAPGEVDVGDLRLTRHEDGWVYGVFNSLRGEGLLADTPAGLVRTHDLVSWERLSDVKAKASYPESLHAGLIKGRYAFYTRRGTVEELVRADLGPLGSGLAFCENVEQAEFAEERSLAAGSSPSLQELALSVGPPPLKTERGWLHLGQSGFMQGLQLLLCDLDEPWRVTDMAAGRLLDSLEPGGGILSCSGAVLRRTGEVLVYYAQVTNKIHVATTTVDRLLDFVIRSPEPVADAAASRAQRAALVDRNLKLLARSKGKAYRGLRSRANKS